MEKRISFTTFQSVKSVARAINPIVVRRDKLGEKIQALIEVYKGYQAQIDTLSAGITNVYGVDVEYLVQKVTENGLSKYVPTSHVVRDEKTKEYVVTIVDVDGDPVASEPVVEEPTPTEEPVAPAVDFAEEAENEPEAVETPANEWE